jgi:hypothetical protein
MGTIHGGAEGLTKAIEVTATNDGNPSYARRGWEVTEIPASLAAAISVVERVRSQVSGDER